VACTPNSFGGNLYQQSAGCGELVPVLYRATGARSLHAYSIRSVKPGGHVIIATFAEDGPEQCSGLPVMHIRPDELRDEFGEAFTLLQHRKETHHTPAGAVQ
jgi:hypothetical protein